MKLSAQAKIITQSVDEKLYKARQLKIQNQYHEAIEMYHRVIFLKEDPQAIFELAQIYEAICDVSSALTFYKKCQHIETTPKTKEKIKQLTLVKGLDLISAGSTKNILHETQFDVFTKRYPTFIKKINAKIQQYKPTHPEIADNLLSCLAYLEVNHRKLALTSLQQCLVINEKDVDIIVLKGLIYWSLFENKEGYEFFWKGYEIDKEHEQIKIFLSMILPKVQNLYKEAKYDLIDNQTTKCKLKVKKALELYPHNTNFLILSSYLHRIKQEYQEALLDLQIANKSLDKSQEKSQEIQNQLRNQISLTYNEMGVYLYKQNKFHQAITLFSEGLSYKPRDWGILCNRGDCYRSLNNFVKALEDYELGYDIEKKNNELNFRIASIYNMRGISLFNSKNFNLAIKEFNESIKYSPQCEGFYLSKAKCLIQVGDKADAIKVLEQAQKIDPLNQEVRNTLNNLRENEEIRVRNHKKVIYLTKQKS